MVSGTEPGTAPETSEARLKRLRMRSMRRGTKEMDILLSRFAEAELATMDEAELALYDRLLEENDNDLLIWVIGQAPAPAPYAGLVARIAAASARA